MKSMYNYKKQNDHMIRPQTIAGNDDENRKRQNGQYIKSG